MGLNINFIINKKVVSQESVLKTVVGKCEGKKWKQAKKKVRLESWCEKF